MEVLQRSINESITILKDPRYRGEAQKKLQRQKLCETAWQIVAFEKFSKLALASNWRNFTPRQRTEFIDVFGRFLCKYYLSKLQEKYRDERVIYLSQELLSDSRALVRVKVLWKNIEVPVEIRMLMHHGTWKAYDVIVLGVSAVMSYRQQFQAILRKDSPSQVIGRIQNRLGRQEKGG